MQTVSNKKKLVTLKDVLITHIITQLFISIRCTQNSSEMKLLNIKIMQYYLIQYFNPLQIISKQRLWQTRYNFIHLAKHCLCLQSILSTAVKEIFYNSVTSVKGVGESRLITFLTACLSSCIFQK